MQTAQPALGRVEPPLAAPLERRRLQCYLAMLIGDGCAIAGGVACANYIYLGSFDDAWGMVQSQLVLPLYWTFAIQNGAYSVRALSDFKASLRLALTALMIASTMVLFVAFLAKASGNFSRVGFLFGLAFSMLFLAWIRDLARDFIKWRCGERPHNLLTISDGVRIDVPGAISLDATANGLVPNLNDPAALHRLATYFANIDRVIVGCPPQRRRDWAMVLKGANIAGEVTDDAVVELGAVGAMRHDGIGTLVVSAGSLGLRARAFKRAIDLSIAGAGILFLAPLLAVVAILIKLEDGGPVLFPQQRVGRANRFFTIYKFRSMRLGEGNHGIDPSVRRDDQRVTQIGRFIRRTSIDELPQLFNVLSGEMSIVGPRPHALGSTAGEKLFWEIDERYWQRHALKPGLTGLAQIRGFRGTTEAESHLSDRLQADLEYLADWTPMRDIRIILATLRVLVHENAF